ncbi:hypothetical protein KKB43_01920 [Patescibacteria group bacterium]|nr:hypothetical protein [Patescibacteria group bacterium]MBU4579752.1 hypothetical protein [Patescibacteria group bacterium]
MNILVILKKIFNNRLGIILAYIFLALFFTFPLILNISDSMSTGKNSIENGYTVNSDSIYFIWNFWFFKHNLIDIGTSPFSHSDMIFYPNGFDVSAGGYDNVFNSLLSLPLQFATDNLILIYNILVLFNFVFAAYSAYLLANYLTKDKKISFISGIIFGFSPFMIARSLIHFNLLTAGAIPLFILFYLKLLKEPKIKNSLFLAIAFFLVTISAWQYGLFAIIFVFFSSIFFAIFRKQKIFNKTYLKSFFLFIILSILLLLPVAFPMIKTAVERKTIPSNFSETLIWSADPFSYITPSPLSNLFGSFIDPKLYNTFSNYMVESTTYLGFLEIAMLIFYLKRRKEMDQKAKYWLYLFIVFFILSLGPHLKMFGLNFEKLPLPYYFILKYIPFFNFAKESVRLSVFIALFSSIIFAFSLKYIFSSKNYNARKNALLVFFALAIIAERMIFPYPIEKIKAPSFYNEISREKENYAILDLPVDSILGFSFYNYYQTMHKKKIVSGKIMPYAFSESSYSFIKEDDFLSQSTCLVDKNMVKPYNPQNSGAIIEKFKKNNIKYVIIHKDLINVFDETEIIGNRKYDCRPLRKNIEIIFGKNIPIYEDELIKVYSI